MKLSSSGNTPGQPAARSERSLGTAVLGGEDVLNFIERYTIISALATSLMLSACSKTVQGSHRRAPMHFCDSEPRAEARPTQAYSGSVLAL